MSPSAMPNLETSPMPTALPDLNEITAINITNFERLSGIPTAEIVGAAVSALCRDGIVVLNNVVDVAHIDRLNDVLCNAIPDLLEDPHTHFNGGRDTGNIAQSPPLTPEYMYRDVWANPFALAVIAAVLGPQPHCNYVLGNTAIGAGKMSQRQKVHADLTFNYPSHQFAIVANYYLCDTDESNGATEVWLRSHTQTNFDMHEQGSSWIEGEYLDAARTAGFGPIRPSVKRGSVVLRDLRLWHAGIPNLSTSPRIMLAFVHFPWWYQNFKKIVLPESARSFIESISDTVVYDAEYIYGEVDHTKIDFQAFFGSSNEAYNQQIPPRKNVGINPYINADGAAKSGMLALKKTLPQDIGGPVQELWQMKKTSVS